MWTRRRPSEKRANGTWAMTTVSALAVMQPDLARVDVVRGDRVGRQQPGEDATSPSGGGGAARIRPVRHPAALSDNVRGLAQRNATVSGCRGSAPRLCSP